ncbi:hypothetical protein, partial [Rhizobium leguminosarum]|uniref:hypothetical protein n=1 Tax=Rhizobium leguminosarum TaxID=384 RepID=UPI003F9BA6A6
TVVEADKDSPNQHPQASIHALPNADEIYKEVTAMADQWNDEKLPMSERTIIKDRLRYLNGRCEWISNSVQRAYVQQPIDLLWQKIIHSA